jgi:hypothetical protein
VRTEGLDHFESAHQDAEIFGRGGSFLNRSCLNRPPTAVLFLGLCCLSTLWTACASSAETAPQREAIAKAAAPMRPSPEVLPSSGRYQLVVVPGQTIGPFLIDTATGCVWNYVANEKTKRPTFIEADVENLHWGWGSGAQQILAAQIEALNYSEEQKRILKQNLQKTECGQFNVTLSPESGRKAEQPQESIPPDSAK